MFDLTRKIFTIFGLNESGKTHLGKHIAKQYKAIVFDVLGEYTNIPGVDSYVPSAKNYPGIAEEFDNFIRIVSTMKKYTLILVDEANRIFPNKRPFNPSMRSYFDTYRHYGQAFGFICRRPTQLNTDIVELSHYIFTFTLKGKNDIQYFNALNSAIGDTPATLSLYHFMAIMPDRSFKVFSPVA